MVCRCYTICGVSLSCGGEHLTYLVCFHLACCVLNIRRHIRRRLILSLHLVVEHLYHDLSEAGDHLEDVAGEVLAPSLQAMESFGEGIHDSLLHIEGVVDIFDEKGGGGAVVAGGDAAHAVVVGAPHLVAIVIKSCYFNIGLNKKCPLKIIVIPC